MEMKVVVKSSKTGDEKLLSNVKKFVWAVGCYWFWFTDEQEDIYLPEKYDQIVSCEIRVLS